MENLIRKYPGIIPIATVHSVPRCTATHSLWHVVQQMIFVMC